MSSPLNSPGSLGPQELTQLVHIARRHYLDGQSKVDIAQETGMSRFKVARMLDDAVRLGIVRFEISAPRWLDTDLSSRLESELGLQRAVVVHAPADNQTVIQEYLGAAAADLLGEILGPEDVLGMTAGRTLSRVAQQVRDLPPVDVVQLAGVAGPRQATGVEVIRRVGQATTGTVWSLYAPLVTTDPAAAAAIRRQHDVAATLRQFPRVTKAMVAVGSWRPPESQLFDNPAVTSAERQALLDQGVQLDLGAILIDRSGSVVTALDERSVAISATALAAVPEVIAVAGGSRKFLAIRAALASGLITSLVTDSVVAKALLKERT